jgi:peptide/nickel transport system substrate-binding protein
MKRRSFLAGSVAALAAPALAQAQRVLKFVPQANLTVLDPIWTTANVTRHHGFMVFDTLFSQDAQFQARPQMAEGASWSDDRLTCTIRLREGLRFHDGEPVRAQDCIASIRRWSQRDVFGQKVREMADEMRAADDRTLSIRLKRPFPLLLDALAKQQSSPCFIMPERLAQTDPNQQVREVVGSGPYRFVREEFNPGSRVVYARNERYQPRSEPPSGNGGGKAVHFDRVEWVVLPDPATAAAAIQTGEVDWWEQANPDLLQVLRRARGVSVERLDPLGSISIMRFNHLHPPFNNPRIRRALFAAVNQGDYMNAMMGNDPDLWRECFGYFPCDTPFASDAGTEPFRAPRNLEAARAEIRAAGYGGEKVVIISPTDFATIHPQGLVTNDLLRRLGFNVEFVATDWGTVVQRRVKREPIDQGGWSIFHTNFEAPALMNPAVHQPLRGNGTSAWPGWPTSPRIEELREAWFAAPSETEQKRICEQMQRVAFEEVPYIPVGRYFLQRATRQNITGIQTSYTPMFWSVRRT